MTREIIAEIRLAPGEIGYYDDYSRIYLSTSKPSAYIYAGTNTTQIRKSIRSGRLRLVSGSLFGPKPAQEAPKAPAKETKKELPEKEPEEVKPVIEEPVAEAPVEEAPAAMEEPVVEAVPEEVPEEAPAEEKPKRRRSRKKAEE